MYNNKITDYRIVLLSLFFVQKSCTKIVLLMTKQSNKSFIFSLNISCTKDLLLSFTRLSNKSLCPFALCLKLRKVGKKKRNSTSLMRKFCLKCCCSLCSDYNGCLNWKTSNICKFTYYCFVLCPIAWQAKDWKTNCMQCLLRRCKRHNAWLEVPWTIKNKID